MSSAIVLTLVMSINPKRRRVYACLFLFFVFSPTKLSATADTASMHVILVAKAPNQLLVNISQSAICVHLVTEAGVIISSTSFVLK